MALQYLEVEARKWRETVAWVQPEVSVTYISIAIELIEQLWSFAKVHYTALGQGKSRSSTPASIESYLTRDRERSSGPNAAMSCGLHYEDPPTEVT
jgi:hypothetical protein